MSRRSRKKDHGNGLPGAVEFSTLSDVITSPQESELNPTLDLISQSFRHCDEYIDDETQPDVLRRFLRRARMPAHGHLSKDPYPTLFATYNGKEWGGINPGDRVRIVLASRMGDVGCTKNLTADHGYQLRCAVADLSDFSSKP